MSEQDARHVSSARLLQASIATNARTHPILGANVAHGIRGTVMRRACVSRRSITARAMVAAVAALGGGLVARAPGAQADPIGTGVIVNSPKGFVGCVTAELPPMGSPYTQYCF